jgi:hypothetical protein
VTEEDAARIMENLAGIERALTRIDGQLARIVRFAESPAVKEIVLTQARISTACAPFIEEGVKHIAVESIGDSIRGWFKRGGKPK